MIRTRPVWRCEGAIGTPSSALERRHSVMRPGCSSHTQASASATAMLSHPGRMSSSGGTIFGLIRPGGDRARARKSAMHHRPQRISRKRPDVSPDERIVCVVVTHDRPECLETALSKVLSQTRRPDCVIVVDNGNKPRTAETVAKFPEVRHVASHRNLGGAGGFALAVMLAMVEGADWIWTMDDDGFPAAPTCLASL